MVRAMVNRPIDSFFPKQDIHLGRAGSRGPGPPRAGNSTMSRLPFRAGEIYGIAGLVGAGRTEVLKTIFGALPMTAGSIRIAGKSHVPHSPRRSLRNGVVLTPEDRKLEGLILAFPIKSECRALDLECIVPLGPPVVTSDPASGEVFHRPVADPGHLGKSGGAAALRRQPTEGRAGPSHERGAQGLHAGRADPRCRCRRQGYNRYADTYGLRTAYDAMKLYLDVTMEKWRKAPDYTPPSGTTEDEHTVTSFLGDWSFPTGAAADATPGQNTNVNATAVTSVANTAYYAYLAKLTADSARVLGKSRRRGEVRRALRAASSATSTPASGTRRSGYYVDPQNTTFMSQAAQVLALAMDLVPAEKRRGLQEKLVNDVLVTRTGHQLTGIASARWIYPVLTAGRARGRAERGQGGVHRGPADDLPVVRLLVHDARLHRRRRELGAGHPHAQPRDVRHDRPVVLRGRGRHQEPRAGLQEDPDPAADHAGRDRVARRRRYDSVQGPIKSSVDADRGRDHDERDHPRQHDREGLRAGQRPVEGRRARVRQGAAWPRTRRACRWSASSRTRWSTTSAPATTSSSSATACSRPRRSTGGVGGTVPATLSLTLGDAGGVRRVHAGRGEGVHGEHLGQRDLHRG